MSKRDEVKELADRLWRLKTSLCRLPLSPIDRHRRIAGYKDTKRRREYFAAREALILANLGLAAELTKRYRRYHDHDDLEQESLVALMRAVDGFDPTRGICFSGFAQLTQPRVQYLCRSD